MFRHISELGWKLVYGFRLSSCRILEKKGGALSFVGSEFSHHHRYEIQFVHYLVILVCQIAYGKKCNHTALEALLVACPLPLVNALRSGDLQLGP